MKILMLYGVNCTKEVWNDLAPYMNDYEIDYVEYPHEVTINVTNVETLTEWVYKKYHENLYDAVIGHSLGGIIALQLVAKYKMKFKEIIYLDTNLKPANEFYKNLMTKEHMDIYGGTIIQMFKEESSYYNEKLFSVLQEDFDYTTYLNDIMQKVYAIYGDRGIPDYPNKIKDLNLKSEVLMKLEIKFIQNSCHMMMIENPKQLSAILKDILN